MSGLISKDAQQIIDRLAAVDLACPAIDRGAVEEALRSHFDVLGLDPLPVHWADDAEGGIGRAQSVAWSAAWSAAQSAAQSAARSRQLSPAERSALDRYRAIWVPFVDAYEAGLWLYWILENEVVAVPHPALQLAGDELHCEDGPAVAWPNGVRYWFWRGVQVSEQVIVAPETLVARKILAERNVEVRRVMIERFGLERMLQEAGAKQIQPDDFGTLWRLEVPNDEPIVMVEVVNSTAELDGTFRNYFLRVPPDVRTPKEAIAWTFDVPSGEYRVEVEA